MNLATLNFARHLVESEDATWDETMVRDLATKVAPQGLGGTSGWLLQGDANYLWARWFLEGLADPLPYLDGRKLYPHLYKSVSDALLADAGQIPADERAELARGLAKLLWREIRGRLIRQRVNTDRETRLLLWDLYPRCWVCGAAFSEWARARFLQENSVTAERTPPFVDFYRPRGAALNDLRIEVEHVVPHSAGGRSEMHNLRLSCGWCNRAKSNRTLIYDAEAATSSLRHPTLGIVSVPQPFWVVRFLAMRGRCENVSGCSSRTTTHELTVAPRNAQGTPNPANLIVVCREHDPLRDVRLVAPTLVTSRARRST
ncbi:HNH endonuclease [Mycolicibacterium vaccae]|nr:HNH endonuclease [Mycolicibacterium vaccae]